MILNIFQLAIIWQAIEKSTNLLLYLLHSSLPPYVRRFIIQLNDTIKYNNDLV